MYFLDVTSDYRSFLLGFLHQRIVAFHFFFGHSSFFSHHLAELVPDIAQAGGAVSWDAGIAVEPWSLEMALCVRAGFGNCALDGNI